LVGCCCWSTAYEGEEEDEDEGYELLGVGGMEEEELVPVLLLLWL
jgi:hypothetical protein